MAKSGRRGGLKIHWRQLRAGSNPAPGTDPSYGFLTFQMVPKAQVRGLLSLTHLTPEPSLHNRFRSFLCFIEFAIVRCSSPRCGTKCGTNWRVHLTNLTAAGVRSAKKPGKYYDGSGLFLLIRVSGSKSWVLRTTVIGKRRDLGLGGYPMFSLAEARAKAAEYRKIARQGLDPVAPGSEALPTVREAAEKVIEMHAAKWKPGGLSEKHWRSSLSNYVFPTIGTKPINEVNSADVMTCLTPIWHSRSTTARRVLQRLSSVMRWSIAQGFRDDNPADDRITAALGSNTQRAHHLQALHHTQVAAALAKVRDSNVYPTARLAFEFAVLTATRSGEARSALWKEINQSEALWEIPAERMKGGRPHRAPLSEQALEMLVRTRQYENGSGLLFPREDGREWPAWKMSKLAADLDLGGTLHGMRSAFRDWCSETGVIREVAEVCLAHQIKNAAERAYARSDLLTTRRTVMRAWGLYVAPRS